MRPSAASHLAVLDISLVGCTLSFIYSKSHRIAPHRLARPIKIKKKKKKGILPFNKASPPLGHFRALESILVTKTKAAVYKVAVVANGGKC